MPADDSHNDLRLAMDYPSDLREGDEFTLDQFARTIEDGLTYYPPSEVPAAQFDRETEERIHARLRDIDEALETGGAEDQESP
jgi:hypothetical protein